MPSRFCFLACLLPLFAALSFNALADTTDGAAQALHALDYVGADYPAAVADGKVINESRYQAQINALKALQEQVVALPARAERDELEKGILDLADAVSRKQDGAVVSRQARQLGARLAVAYEV